MKQWKDEAQIHMKMYVFIVSVCT